MESRPDVQGGRVNWLQIVLISLIATIGGFLISFENGATNATIDGLERQFGWGDLENGFSVGSVLFGCAVGALAAGRAAEISGRRGDLVVAPAGAAFPLADIRLVAGADTAESCS